MPTTNQVMFSALPDSLRDELLAAYNEIAKNYKESRWEPSELNGGKLSEVAYAVIKGYLDGNYPLRASKPSNFELACRQLPQISPQATEGLESMRLTIPRVLIALYDIRNHRSVGHVGGDVDPNHMDASVVLSMSKWVMAELIRVLHQTDTVKASQAVEALTERTLPYIWEIDGIKRVIGDGFKKQDQVLHLLYATTKPVSIKEMATWTATRSDNLKRILRKMHSDNLVHLNVATGMITLSPKGVQLVEAALRAAP